MAGGVALRLTYQIRPELPLHFNSIKDQSAYEVLEGAESSRPEIIALDAIVVYFQSTFIFPSGTSGVSNPAKGARRSRSPDQALQPMGNGRFGCLRRWRFEKCGSKLVNI